MRILYLCPDLGIPLGGTKGAAVHARSLIGAFAAEGHEVVVVTGGGEASELGVPVVAVPIPGIATEIGSTTDLRMGRALAHLWNNAAVETTLRQVAEWFRPQLVYERYSPFGAAGALVARRLRVLHVLEVNAPLAWEGEHYRKQALADAARALEQSAFETTARIVAVSAELKAILVAQGVPAAKVTVVPNGVDLARFTPNGAGWEGRAGQVVVGFVGSLKPWHGVDLLMRGFREAAALRPDLHLLVIGDGPDARLVDAVAKDLPGRCTRLPAVPHPEVPRYLRGMAIAVAPYKALERFYYSPLKLLEYLATGRAVVASAVGQVAELVRHEETGLLVPPGDAGALGAALIRLADDPGLRQRLGSAARRDAERHGWDARAREIAGLARAAA